MAHGISSRTDDAGYAVLVDTEEAMRCARRNHGVQGDLQTAIGAVLEANGHRQTTGHFAMCLRFGRPRPIGHPGHQIVDILWNNWVEKFRSGGQPHTGEVQQESARLL